MQSYLHVSIDQNKGDSNYQSTHKDKLGKIIQSLLSMDETAPIVKYSEHAIKVQDNLVALEDEALTNATQLSHSLTKTQQFFHRGKPKPNGSRFYTNMCIIHTVEIRDIIGDLEHKLEIEGINLGLQRAQHHDVIKLGYIFGMTDKIDTQDWTERLQEILLKVLQCELKLSLQA